MKPIYSFVLLLFIIGCSPENDEDSQKKDLPLEISLSSVDSIEEEQVNAAGTIKNYEKSSISEVGFCWSVESNPSVSDNVVTVNSVQAEFNSSITDLQPNTSYYIRAYATNGSKTFYSNEKSFTTKAALNILINSVEDISTRQAKIFGSIENMEDSEIEEIGLVWSTTEGPEMSDNHMKMSSVTEEFKSVLEGLEPNTRYYTRAYAVVKERIVFSDDFSFKTEPVRIACETTYTFDANYAESTEAGVKTADGGFLIAGYIIPFFGNRESDALILKYDSNCELQWEVVLHDPQTSEFPQNIIEDREGNILISSGIFNSNGSKSALTKLDPSGNVLWQSVIDEQKSNTEEKYGNESLIQTLDGNYVLVGNRNPDFYSDEYPDSNFSIIKISTNGDLMYQHHYGTLGNPEHAWDVIENSNGDLMLIGSAKGDNGTSDLKLVKLDADGSFKWDKLIGSSSNEYPRAVIPSLDGNLYVSGSSSSNMNTYQLWVYKLDWAGEIIWETSLERPNQTIEVDGPTSIFEGTDGNLYIAAEISADMFIVSLDPGGNELWTKSYGSQQGGFDAGKSIIQLDNGDLMVAGYKEDESNPLFDGSRSDIWILKLTDD